jgi:hypothetical protein
LSDACRGNVALKCYVEANGRAVVTTRTDYNLSHAVKREYDVKDLMGANDKGMWSARSGALRQLIEETVDVESWAANGGETDFTIQFDAGWMTVMTTTDTHRDLQNLLEQLRDSRAEK